MNIKEELTCQYCKNIYNHPIILGCCFESICKHHIEELVDSSTKFKCPLCHQENTNTNFKANKLIEELIKRDLHQFKINPNNERVLNDLKTSIQNLETELKDPENIIYEQISELKRQVDLDRERIKSEIDTLADGFIQQLESHGKRFKTEYKANKFFAFYNDLIELSKKRLAEYEQCLSLFSVDNKKRGEKCKQNERLVEELQFQLRELKETFCSNVSIKYKKKDINVEEIFGKLIIKSNIKKIIFLEKSKMKLKGHTDEIFALAKLKNGDLISGSSDNSVIIWNMDNGTPKQKLNGHADWLRDILVFDNNRLINASINCSINIWNTHGIIEYTLKGHNNSVRALVLLRNGDLASGSMDKTIKIWDIVNGTLKKTLYGHKKTVRSLVVLNNGDLASASEDTSIKIWDLNRGVAKKTLIGHTGYVNRLALLKSGDLVSGSEDTTIIIWDIEAGVVKRTLTGHKSCVSALKVFNNGDLVSGSGYGEIKIWDVENGTVRRDVQKLINEDSRINSLEILDNGDLASASFETITIWDLALS